MKALRVLTDVGQRTTLATLYQAGENIYSHFDKVLLIDQGYQVFFGHADKARAYFEELGFIQIPGQTTAEFLTTVPDPEQRRTQPGSPAAQMRSPRDMAAAFKASAMYAQLQIEMKSYERETAGRANLIPTSSYNLPCPLQIWECLRRESQLVRGQLRVYQIKWITTIILCLVVGSAYYDLSLTGQGAFTRGGILFFALILNGWLQFPELFDAHTNRAVLERQGQSSPTMYTILQ